MSNNILKQEISDSDLSNALVTKTKAEGLYDQKIKKCENKINKADKTYEATQKTMRQALKLMGVGAIVSVVGSTGLGAGMLLLGMTTGLVAASRNSSSVNSYNKQTEMKDQLQNDRWGKNNSEISR